MHLLIVEDEWLVAGFIADIALAQNIPVAGIADSYMEALRILEQERVDFAIIDINIRGVQSGIEVARFLKTRSIPFLFLTAYKEMQTIQEAAELSPLSYLIKPISEEALSAAFLIARNFISVKKPVKLPYEINAEGMIFHKGELLNLSSAERTVFALLLKNHRNVVSHELFFEHLWDDPDNINEGTLRNVILKLRKKYGLKIDNIRNTGYALSL